MSEINNLIDKISILFSEFILGIVIIDDKEFVVLSIGGAISGILDYLIDSPRKLDRYLRITI